MHSKAPSATASRRLPSNPSFSNAAALSRSKSAAADVLTEVNDLHSAVSEIESRLSAEGNAHIPDDMLPAAAQDMGTGERLSLTSSARSPD